MEGFYIVAPKRNHLVLGAQHGSSNPGTKVTTQEPSGHATQLWRFDGTPIPGVFYIKSSATDLCLTVPDNAEQRSEPTLEKRRSGFQPQQLWKFITAIGDSDLLIQNYSIDSPLGLDTRSAVEPGIIVHMWTSQTTNDSQKFYVQYHK